MDWKKNNRIRVKIEDMGDSGEGIGKSEGFTWFIKDAVIGDEVEARVMKLKKSYGYARLEKIIKASACRITPPCPVARPCGGCQLQAMEYQEQLKYKERKIYNHIKRIGGFKEVPMLPIMGMDEPWRYRNKSQFPWGLDKDGHIITGFYAGRTHEIIANADCLLGIKENREILDIVKSHLERYRIRPYAESTHTGSIRHTLIRKGFRSGEIMVCQVINGKSLPHQKELTERLLKVPGMSSISISINQERTNVILGDEIINLHGPGYISDRIGEVTFHISPLSFYQVNPLQTEKLYSTVLEYAALTGNETVWDLYCGIGTISLFLAQKAKKVYGVEIVPGAIEDAKANAEMNGIKNVEFLVGKVEEVLPRESRKNQAYADVIVIDPPRKGCDEVCLDTIIRMNPQKVIYVSCDSATLARDLKYLAERGYGMEKVRGCDMFAQTGHVECVVLMSRKDK